MDLSRPVTVLDGGMGKHLERFGAPFRQPEWSALALLEAPHTVREAHEAFIASGADVVTSNSYAVVPFHLGQERFDEQGAELASLAGQLAREAADTSGRSIKVAGSLPPLYGSYEPDRFRPKDAPPIYRVLVEAQAPHVDFWIGETIGSIAEAEAILDAVEQGPGPEEVWLAFAVPDIWEGDTQVIRSGESIKEVAEAVADRCEAILFNCSPPERITEALTALTATLVSDTGAQLLRVGGYGNGFEPREVSKDANELLLGARHELTPSRYRDIAEEWVNLGASIVGGCCHIDIEHITALAARFAD